jgi:hypothetical protein
MQTNTVELDTGVQVCDSRHPPGLPVTTPWLHAERQTSFAQVSPVTQGKVDEQVLSAASSHTPGGRQVSPDEQSFD